MSHLADLFCKIFYSDFFALLCVVVIVVSVPVAMWIGLDKKVGRYIHGTNKGCHGMNVNWDDSVVLEILVAIIACILIVIFTPYFICQIIVGKLKWSKSENESPLKNQKKENE